MNPYDRRAVRSVWARVMPGRDVFAPGSWPAPPSTGRGGLPPTPPRNPDDNNPPMSPGWPQPWPGGRPPMPPGQGDWQQGTGGRPEPPNQGGWQQPGQGGRPNPLSQGSRPPMPPGQGGGPQPGPGNRPPMPPGQGGGPQPGPGNRPPMPPGQGGGPQPGPGNRPPMPPGQGGRPPENPSAGVLLLELAAGYDALARRYRSPGLRQMAAQCRRGEAALRSRCGVHGTFAGTADTTLQSQREREAALRRALEALPESCAQLARQLIRESQGRARQLSRMR